jgi:predicted outer membrane repeat protein
MHPLNKLLLIVTLLFAFSNVLLAQTIISGGYVSGTWTYAGSPYQIQGSITIHTDSSLIIEQDVEVIFFGDYELKVNGSLNAEGVISDSILFTADNISQGWQGINIDNATDSVRISYSIIEHSNSSGIESNNSALIISNTNLRYNSGGFGGGLSATDSYCKINECGFRNNIAGTGGGLAFVGACYISLINSVFNNNEATGDGGGGVYCIGGGDFVFRECEFNNNYSGSSGGAIFTDDIDGLKIYDSEFLGNVAVNAGAVWGYQTHYLSDVTNSNFESNQSGGGVGGVLFLSVLTATNILSSSTVVNNSEGGAALSGPFSIIKNCTFSGNENGALNSSSDTTDVINSIFEGTTGGNAVNHQGGISLRYSDFYNNPIGNVGPTIPPNFGILDSTNYNGDSCDVYSNIFLNPMFVNKTAGDYHLLEDSPCIDAGDPSSPPDPDNTIADIAAFYYDQTVVSIKRDFNLSPNSFALSQNYPNPFNPNTKIEYQIPELSLVTLRIYDTLGNEVMTLVNEEQSGGNYKVEFDSSNLPSGIYFYRLEANGFDHTKKMILLR